MDLAVYGFLSDDLQSLPASLRVFSAGGGRT